MFIFGSQDNFHFPFPLPPGTDLIFPRMYFRFQFEWNLALPPTPNPQPPTPSPTSSHQWQLSWRTKMAAQVRLSKSRINISFVHDRHKIFFNHFTVWPFVQCLKIHFINLKRLPSSDEFMRYFRFNFRVDAFTFKFTSTSVRYLQQTLSKAINFSVRRMQECKLVTERCVLKF